MELTSRGMVIKLFQSLGLATDLLLILNDNEGSLKAFDRRT